MGMPRGYPIIRLELACGCKEVDTAPGCTNSYECAAHSTRDGSIALVLARAEIDRHNIITVWNGGGVVRLQDGI